MRWRCEGEAAQGKRARRDSVRKDRLLAVGRPWRERDSGRRAYAAAKVPADGERRREISETGPSEKGKAWAQAQAQGSKGRMEGERFRRGLAWKCVCVCVCEERRQAAAALGRMARTDGDGIVAVEKSRGLVTLVCCGGCDLGPLGLAAGPPLAAACTLGEPRFWKEGPQRPKAKRCIGPWCIGLLSMAHGLAGLGARTRPRYPGRCRLRAGLLALGRGERSLVSLLGP